MGSNCRWGVVEAKKSCAKLITRDTVGMSRGIYAFLNCLLVLPVMSKVESLLEMHEPAMPRNFTLPIHCLYWMFFTKEFLVKACKKMYNT